MVVLLTLIPGSAPGGEVWQDALRAMRLPAGTPALCRSNCISTLLRAYQSNDIVKAVVILPGVSDDFYLINKNLQGLNVSAQNLWEAISGLTQSTHVRATFRAPVLFLHLKQDRLDGLATSYSGAVVKRLRTERKLGAVLWVDRNWEAVQPILRERLGLEVLPTAGSPDGWHFARLNLVASGLNDWDLLTALSLGSKTKFTVTQDRLRFQERFSGIR